MKWTSMLLAVALLAPGLAHAQKRPSNSVHTRSADLYLGQAEQAKSVADRNELFGKALRSALEGVKADPANPRPWFQAGVAYLRMGDVLGADSAFRRAEQMYPEYAAEIDPERENAWIASYNQGVQAFQAGDPTTAIAALELAQVIHAKRPEALVLLGSLHLQTGNPAKAEGAFTAALAILRGPGRKTLKPDEAADWAEDERTVSMRLATLYADQDRNEDAIRVYRDLLASQPDNLSAQASLAVVLARAGRADEAARMYRDLLERENVPEATLFNIGVGLFRAEQYDQAVRAFRRAAAVSPHSHEILYNLAQSLIAHTGALEKRQPRPTEELLRAYEEMRTTAETLRGIDPANRTVLMILGQAQRSLGELAGQTAQGTEWRKQVVTTLETSNALPFEVSDITLAAGAEETLLAGKVTNLKAAAGTPVKLRFSILDRAGAELVAHEVSVTLPPPEQITRFDARLRIPSGAAAWRYSVIGS